MTFPRFVPATGGRTGRLPMARQALLNSILSPFPSTASRRSMLNCVTIVPKRVSILCARYQRSSCSINFFGSADFSRRKLFESNQRLYGGKTSAPTSVIEPRLSYLRMPSQALAPPIPLPIMR